MKKILTSVFSLILISTATFAQTPTVETIIENYAKGLGGKDAIAKIQDVSMSMTGEVQGMNVEMVSQKKSPGKILMTVTVAGMGEMQKLQSDGKKVRMTAQGNVTDLLDKDAKAVIATQAGLFPELNYLSSGVKLTLAGTEKINGKDAYKVDATLDDKNWSDYFDAETGLKVRQVMTSDTPMGQQTITLTFSDFKDVSGVKFAHKINQDAGVFQIDMTASKVEVNKNLDNSIFVIQ